VLPTVLIGIVTVVAPLFILQPVAQRPFSWSRASWQTISDSTAA
jgi:hypothetical protein